MPIRILHTADIHLDSPLRGLAPYEGAPVEALRAATRHAFERVIELTFDEKVDLLLIAGDLYDGDWGDYRTGLYFVSQMAKLHDARIPVCIVAGNHDARSVITRSLRLPPNVHLLPAAAPKTVVLDELGIAVHGQSFATRSVQQELARGYPAPVAGLFNIGLLHTSADGREGHDTYAPCTVAGLASKGFDYWALGHVHRREVLSRAPWIVFPGNLQGRHARETGAKGATLITVEGAGVAQVEHRVLDVVRWSLCEVEADGAAHGEEVLDRFATSLSRELEAAAGRPLCARVRIAGRCGAHEFLSRDPDRWSNEIRATATAASSGRAWIEKVEVATRAEQAPASVSDAFLDLVRPAEALVADEQLLAEARADLSDLARKLPAELRQGHDGLDLDSVDALGSRIRRAREILTARLVGMGEAPK